MNDKYTHIKPNVHCGMCGYIWQVIQGIFHNPDKKYYIDFAGSIYKTNNTDNVWDYFFKQPHTNTKPDAQFIEKEVGRIQDPASEYVWGNIVPNTTEEIQKRRLVFSKIIKDYCVLQNNTQHIVDLFVEQHFKNKRVLGVHLRGTDHPHKKPIHEYLRIIKEKLIDYDVLFVCSDDNERFVLAETMFSEKVVSYNALRSFASNTPLHCCIHNPMYQRNNSFEYQHKIAEDVIVEAFLMSKVDFLMCCPDSNVNMLARAINPTLSSMSL